MMRVAGRRLSTPRSAPAGAGADATGFQVSAAQDVHVSTFPIRDGTRAADGERPPTYRNPWYDSAYLAAPHKLFPDGTPRRAPSFLMNSPWRLPGERWNPLIDPSRLHFNANPNPTSLEEIVWTPQDSEQVINYDPFRQAMTAQAYRGIHSGPYMHYGPSSYMRKKMTSLHDVPSHSLDDDTLARWYPKEYQIRLRWRKHHDYLRKQAEAKGEPAPDPLPFGPPVVPRDVKITGDMSPKERQVIVDGQHYAYDARVAAAEALKADGVGTAWPYREPGYTISPMEKLMARAAVPAPAWGVSEAERRSYFGGSRHHRATSWAWRSTYSFLDGEHRDRHMVAHSALALAEHVASRQKDVVVQSGHLVQAALEAGGGVAAVQVGVGRWAAAQSLKGHSNAHKRRVKLLARALDDNIAVRQMHKAMEGRLQAQAEGAEADCRRGREGAAVEGSGGGGAGQAAVGGRGGASSAASAAAAAAFDAAEALSSKVLRVGEGEGESGAVGGSAPLRQFGRGRGSGGRSVVGNEVADAASALSGDDAALAALAAGGGADVSRVSVRDLAQVEKESESVLRRGGAGVRRSASSPASSWAPDSFFDCCERESARGRSLDREAARRGGARGRERQGLLRGAMRIGDANESLGGAAAAASSSGTQSVMSDAAAALRARLLMLPKAFAEAVDDVAPKGQFGNLFSNSGAMRGFNGVGSVADALATEQSSVDFATGRVYFDVPANVAGDGALAMNDNLKAALARDASRHAPHSSGIVTAGLRIAQTVVRKSNAILGGSMEEVEKALYAAHLIPAASAAGVGTRPVPLAPIHTAASRVSRALLSSAVVRGVEEQLGSTVRSSGSALRGGGGGRSSRLASSLLRRTVPVLAAPTNPPSSDAVRSSEDASKEGDVSGAGGEGGAVDPLAAAAAAALKGAPSPHSAGSAAGVSDSGAGASPSSTSSSSGASTANAGSTSGSSSRRMGSVAAEDEVELPTFTARLRSLGLTPAECVDVATATARATATDGSATVDVLHLPTKVLYGLLHFGDVFGPPADRSMKRLLRMLAPRLERAKGLSAEDLAADLASERRVLSESDQAFEEEGVIDGGTGQRRSKLDRMEDFPYYKMSDLDSDRISGGEVVSRARADDVKQDATRAAKDSARKGEDTSSTVASSGTGDATADGRKAASTISTAAADDTAGGRGWLSQRNRNVDEGDDVDEVAAVNDQLQRAATRVRVGRGLRSLGLTDSGLLFVPAIMALLGGAVGVATLPTVAAAATSTLPLLSAKVATVLGGGTFIAYTVRNRYQMLLRPLHAEVRTGVRTAAWSLGAAGALTLYLEFAATTATATLPFGGTALASGVVSATTSALLTTGAGVATSGLIAIGMGWGLGRLLWVSLSTLPAWSPMTHPTLFRAEAAAAEAAAAESVLASLSEDDPDRVAVQNAHTTAKSVSRRARLYRGVLLFVFGVVLWLMIKIVSVAISMAAGYLRKAGHHTPVVLATEPLNSVAALSENPNVNDEHVVGGRRIVTSSGMKQAATFVPTSDLHAFADSPTLKSDKFVANAMADPTLGVWVVADGSTSSGSGQVLILSAIAATLLGGVATRRLRAVGTEVYTRAVARQLSRDVMDCRAALQPQVDDVAVFTATSVAAMRHASTMAARDADTLADEVLSLRADMSTLASIVQQQRGGRGAGGAGGAPGAPSGGGGGHDGGCAADIPPTLRGNSASPAAAAAATETGPLRPSTRRLSAHTSSFLPAPHAVHRSQSAAGERGVVNARASSLVRSASTCVNSASKPYAPADTHRRPPTSLSTASATAEADRGTPDATAQEACDGDRNGGAGDGNLNHRASVQALFGGQTWEAQWGGNATTPGTSTPPPSTSSAQGSLAEALFGAVVGEGEGVGGEDPRSSASAGGVGARGGVDASAIRHAGQGDDGGICGGRFSLSLGAEDDDNGVGVVGKGLASDTFPTPPSGEPHNLPAPPMESLSSDVSTWPGDEEHTPLPLVRTRTSGGKWVQSLAVSEETVGGDGGAFSAEALWGARGTVGGKDQRLQQESVVAACTEAAPHIYAYLSDSDKGVCDALQAAASPNGFVLNCPRSLATLSFIDQQPRSTPPSQPHDTVRGGASAIGEATATGVGSARQRVCVVDSPYQAPAAVRAAAVTLAVAAAGVEPYAAQQLTAKEAPLRLSPAEETEGVGEALSSLRSDPFDSSFPPQPPHSSVGGVPDGMDGGAHALSERGRPSDSPPVDSVSLGACAAAVATSVVSSTAPPTTVPTKAPSPPTSTSPSSPPVPPALSSLLDAAVDGVVALRVAREVAWTGVTQRDGGSLPAGVPAPLPPHVSSAGSGAEMYAAQSSSSALSPPASSYDVFNDAVPVGSTVFDARGGGVVVDGLSLAVAAKARMGVDDPTRWPATAAWGSTRSLTPPELEKLASALPFTRLQTLDLSGQVVAPLPYPPPRAVVVTAEDDCRSDAYIPSARAAAPRDEPIPQADVDPSLDGEAARQAYDIARSHPLAQDIDPLSDTHVQLYEGRKRSAPAYVHDTLGTAVHDGHPSSSPTGKAFAALVEGIVATPTLRCVDFTGMQLGTAPLRTLFSALPAAQHIRSLSVAGCAANHRIGGAVEAYLPSSSLVDFNIAANPQIGDLGIGGVVRGALACPTLRALSVAHCSITDASLTVVGEQLQTAVAPLEHLNLGLNPFRGGGMGDGCAALASGLAACDTLRSLSLAGSHMLGPFAHHIFGALPFATLESLDIASCAGLDTHALRALSVVLPQTRLRSLNVTNLATSMTAGGDLMDPSDAYHSQDASLALAASLPATLQQLLAAGAGVSDRFLRTMSYRLGELSSLRDVDLSGNVVSEGALFEFVSALRWTCVWKSFQPTAAGGRARSKSSPPYPDGEDGVVDEDAAASPGIAAVREVEGRDVAAGEVDGGLEAVESSLTPTATDGGHGAFSCASQVGQLNLSALVSPQTSTSLASFSPYTAPSSSTASPICSPLSLRVMGVLAELVADPQSTLHTLHLSTHDPHPATFRLLFEALRTPSCRLKVLTVGPVDATSVMPAVLSPRDAAASGKPSWRDVSALADVDFAALKAVVPPHMALLVGGMPVVLPGREVVAMPTRFVFRPYYPQPGFGYDRLMPSVGVM